MVEIIAVFIFCIFVLYVIFHLGYLVIKYNSPKHKGDIGEKVVRQKLIKLDKNKYTIFNDLVFNINGKKSQIDHLVVSDFGIFVIETKNYKGSIYGSETSYNWTQYLSKKQFKLYNPIKQNQGHIYALENVLKGLMPINFISIVVFTNRAKLKVKSYTPVIFSNELLKVIKSNDEVSLNHYMKDAIIETINKHNLNSNK